MVEYAIDPDETASGYLPLPEQTVDENRPPISLVTAPPCMAMRVRIPSQIQKQTRIFDAYPGDGPTSTCLKLHRCFAFAFSLKTVQCSRSLYGGSDLRS